MTKIFTEWIILLNCLTAFIIASVEWKIYYDYLDKKTTANVRRAIAFRWNAISLT